MTRNRLYAAVGVLGEVLITLGVVLGLFIVWQNWWTDRAATSQMVKERATVVSDWGATIGPDGIIGPVAPSPHAGSVHSRSATPPNYWQTAPGVHTGHKKRATIKTLGFVYVPALHTKQVWAAPIVEGITRPALALGLGHYPKTAALGGIGNSVLAGHRNSHGALLRYIDKLRKGDHVVVRIRDRWFVYVLDRSTIVRPTAHWVMRNRPFPSNYGRLITLVSCHPAHQSRLRFVWWGHLARSIPATGKPPAELKLKR